VKLRVIETAGFGDQLDKEKRWINYLLRNVQYEVQEYYIKTNQFNFSAQVIVDYINFQFEAYLKEELKVKRNLSYYDDTRIHACLYFISPTGHG
jgi:septin family protein